jgi:microcompartment protein CcmK/EutM
VPVPRRLDRRTSVLNEKGWKRVQSAPDFLRRAELPAFFRATAVGVEDAVGGGDPFDGERGMANAALMSSAEESSVFEVSGVSEPADVAASPVSAPDRAASLIALIRLAESLAAPSLVVDAEDTLCSTDDVAVADTVVDKDVGAGFGEMVVLVEGVEAAVGRPVRRLIVEFAALALNLGVVGVEDF